MAEIMGMSDIQLAKGLGWFSLGLGAIELVFGRRLNRGLRLRTTPALVRGFGAREMAAGAMILVAPDAAGPMWMRVAGDALDLVVLLRALGSGRRRHGATVLATAAVLGVTALDVLAAGALTQRQSRALATAERTRIRPSLA